MSASFEGKVVIVTGSSNGIGRTTATIFAEKGAKLTLSGRSKENMQITHKLCLDAGAKSENILEVFGEIENRETREMIISNTVDKFGQIDVLVNNAGMAMDSRGFAPFEVPLEQFDHTVAVNTRAVLHLSQLAVPYLQKTQGSIVNVSSIASHLFAQSDISYAMAKAALDQLTVQMAAILARKGIRVNGVNPGPTQTGFLRNNGVEEEKSKAIMKSLGKRAPLGRSGLPEDVAKLIVFLADRQQSEFIIGQRIVIDGGLLLNNALGSKI